MRLGIASWSFILITLIILIGKNGSARKIAIKTETDNQLMNLKQSLTEDLVVTNILQIEGTDNVKLNKNSDEKEDDDDHHKHKVDEDSDDDDHEHDDSDHKKKGKQDSIKRHKDEHKNLIMDPDLNVFFTPKDLYVGKTMRAYFAKRNSSISPKFLPREEAEKIPFSSKNLFSLLKFFSLPKHSPQAKAMKHTLKNCEFEPMVGDNETKFCSTSLESLLDSARQVFRSDAQLKVLTTNHITNSRVLLQNYRITEVKEISVPNMLECHRMPYPYAVFYCHSHQNDTNLYEVLVEGENGDRVQAAAVCHVDTSMCHFFPSDSLVLVLSPAALATPSP